ncbi:MAG: MaoC family dehydratase N-terminal domain-containing protein [Kiloniellaceae bacterium]
MTAARPAVDLARWRAWIGRTQSAEDVIDPRRARALQAALDDPAPPLQVGDPLPPLWHWLYFWTVAPGHALGPDGHPARGGFLPPIELPRRMWAGSRVTFHGPLALGAAASRRSELTDIQLKEGSSGRLAFVSLRHQIAVGGKVCIDEAQDLVYREAPQAGEAPRPGEPAPAEAPWRREIVPEPVLLFRYSALTFNGHRIHYDYRYATEVDGYPGLVVHGPLLATLMVGLARAERPEATVTRFEFRALRPIFDGAPFVVAGRPAGDGKSAELWVVDPEGMRAMQGRLGLA